MTDYVVNVYDLDDRGPIFHATYKFKVKHFRQWKGRQMDTYGGYTAIFDQASGMVFSSKCREDEQFSRRKGLLTCVQKALVCPPFFGTTNTRYNWISDWSFKENSVDVYISHMEPKDRWGWLVRRL